MLISDDLQRIMTDNLYHAATVKSYDCLVDPVCSYTQTFEASPNKDFDTTLFSNTTLNQEFVTQQTLVPVYPSHSENIAQQLVSIPNSSLYTDSNSLVKTEIQAQEPSCSNYVYNPEVSSTNVLVDAEGDQTHEDELKLYKQWLLLHMDLIQEQNYDIIEKDKQIDFLKTENHLLKEKIKSLERSVVASIAFNPNTVEDHCCESVQQPEKAERFEIASSKGRGTSKDMTEDCHSSIDSKEDIDVVDSIKKEDFLSSTLEVIHFGGCDIIRANEKSESQLETILEVDEESHFGVTIPNNLNQVNNTVNSDTNNAIKVNNFREFDPYKHSQMNMRRRRVESGSESDSIVVRNRDRTKRLKRRNKSHSKSSSINILTSKEPYVNIVNNDNVAIIEQEELNAASTSSLEVPNWRIKLYSSLYTMEGTENLDDEVFNKRHSRLENDERRRKRWDVQRIREQRIIEKLKQRQERVGAKGEDNQDVLVSLWPKPEDVRFIEITEEIPVAAFGHPLPRNLAR